MMKSIKSPNQYHINDQQVKFLEYCCTEMSYRQIANKMCLSGRTVEGYRDQLFEKLRVHKRLELVKYALKSGLVNINEI